MLYLLLCFILITNFAIFVTVLGLIFSKERPINKLKFFDKQTVYEKKHEANFHKTGPIKRISQIIPKIKFLRKSSDRLELELIRADVPITADEFILLKLLFSLAFSFLAFSFTKNILVVVFVFLLVWRLPNFIVKKQMKKRVAEFNQQLSEGIMIISNSLKAGYSFLQAVAVASEEMKAPFSKEFKILLKEMSLGIPEEFALQNMLLRMQSDELRLIMNAVLIQKDIGGNLSEILDNISETLRERQKMSEELKTLMAQGKLSGIIISMLPVFLGLFIFVLNRSYMIALFTTPLGIAMIVAAVFNELIGLLLIKKIVNIEL